MPVQDLTGFFDVWGMRSWRSVSISKSFMLPWAPTPAPWRADDRVSCQRLKNQQRERVFGYKMPRSEFPGALCYCTVACASNLDIYTNQWEPKVPSETFPDEKSPPPPSNVVRLRLRLRTPLVMSCQGGSMTNEASATCVSLPSTGHTFQRPAGDAHHGDDCCVKILFWSPKMD
jgi:hypothetical protein